MNRREFVRRTVAASVMLSVGATGIFEIAKLWDQQNGQLQQVILPSPTTSATTAQQQQQKQQSVSASSSTSAGAPSGYFLVGQLSGLAGKSSMYFTHPQYGTSILLSLNGEWKAFSAECTHRPCTVTYRGSGPIYCPCHGATFDASNGNPLGGPVYRGLAEYAVQVQADNVYVSNSQST